MADEPRKKPGVYQNIGVQYMMIYDVVSNSNDVITNNQKHYQTTDMMEDGYGQDTTPRYWSDTPII